jgi:hypothetical protein
MSLKYISKRLVIGGTLLIWVIKFIIRPAQLVSPPFDFVLGIAPNLLGSFLLPFGAYWLGDNKYIQLNRFVNVNNSYGIRQYCFAMLVLLIINEYLQKIPVFGRTFDLFDIFFSALGLLIAYIAVIKFLPHSKTNAFTKTRTL